MQSSWNIKLEIDYPFDYVIIFMFHQFNEKNGIIKLSCKGDSNAEKWEIVLGPYNFFPNRISLLTLLKLKYIFSAFLRGFFGELWNFVILLMISFLDKGFNTYNINTYSWIEGLNNGR